MTTSRWNGNPRLPDSFMLIDTILEGCREEGLEVGNWDTDEIPQWRECDPSRQERGMSYSYHEFRREYVKEHLRYLTPEERLESLSREERLLVLKNLPWDEQLALLDEMPCVAIAAYLKRRLGEDNRREEE
jgi:hypothetical protein